MTPTSKDAPILTLPVDLLKRITNKLEPADEANLRQTCKRMKFLIVRPQPVQHHFLAVTENPPPRDGRNTPIPQSPMPWKAAQTLEEVEQENRGVEDRERSQGMELSDTEDGYSDDDRSVIQTNKPTKFAKKNILHWTADLDTAPSSPSTRSPTAASFVHSPRQDSPGPKLPSFTVTTS